MLPTADTDTDGGINTTHAAAVRLRTAVLMPEERRKHEKPFDIKRFCEYTYFVSRQRRSFRVSRTGWSGSEHARKLFLVAETAGRKSNRVGRTEPVWKQTQ